LSLTPLRVEDAAAMAPVLGDERLHEFIGGRPPTAAELRERYEALAAGSPESAVTWLNWIVRLRADETPIGTVQATLSDGNAAIAWVIGTEWQNQGFASEAARALVDWLLEHRARTIEAHVHPDHFASARVAARAGLALTDEVVDGEQVWRLQD
jgi:RimJ/RimL family protein N-acetyltransferase